MKVLNATENMVYCNGDSKTSLGGAVYLPDNADESVWVEMTEAEADAWIAENNPEPEEPDEEITDAEALRIITEGVTEND